MAMTVLYNSGAQSALSTLNKNNLQANNSLLKLSSGERFIGAQGESASYAISEKMREQIRSLYQDEQNVQNGSSLVKTAERGIDQIIENLRTMKELAIDAANDSNTDEDRHTIQKEIDERRKVINDIAIGTQYNGKILLDGRWTGGLTPLSSGSGGKNNTVENVVSGFLAGSNATSGNYTTSGGSGSWKLDADVSFRKESYSSRDYSVQLDFSSMTVNGSYPDVLNGQGFTVLCDGCPQYINIIFDSSRTTAQSTYNSTPNTSEDGIVNDRAREFIIGVKDVKSADQLAGAIFDGISAVSNRIEKSYTSTTTYSSGLSYTSYISSNHQNTANDILVNAAHDFRIRRESDGKVYFTKSSNEMLFMEGTIPNPLTNPIPEVKPAEIKYNPLWIQHGTRAGQRMHIFIGNMQSGSLGIDEAEVVTREKATKAIGIIEGAIEKALDEATNMGAYLQRLEVSSANIVTMNENTQGSESTIRDADMAKEITEYTKYNLLSQSAQAMLAQANTNSSLVLALLQ